MSTLLHTWQSPVSAPCIQASGPRDAKIMLIGEAPGAEEETQGVPFVGQSGQELTRMMEEAGLDRNQCYLTNVLWTRPPNNKLDQFLISRAELPKQYELAPVQRYPRVLYLHPAFLPELVRLFAEIDKVNPNIIVALGGTALWAVTGAYVIGRIRGTIVEGIAGRKVLPTYHPAAILRKWSDRVLVVTDLAKARKQSLFPEIRRPVRQLWVEPTLADIQRWIDQELYSCELLAIDTETRNGQITEVGLSTRRDLGLVVPFVRDFNSNYWATSADETLAWELVRTILEYPVPKLFQNGLYDLQYFLHHGVKPWMKSSHDTMLFHHALFPEMAKGLGHLGSIYTDEPAWKLLRQGVDTAKRDDE